jgi:hypothetical protein
MLENYDRFISQRKKYPQLDQPVFDDLTSYYYKKKNINVAKEKGKGRKIFG